MKITVLGCGAQGQLWLAALHQQGHVLQGWLRVPQPYCDVHLLDSAGGHTFDGSFTANDPQFLADSELLLVTLKALRVTPALRTLTTQLSPDCPILLLHNGMGTRDELVSLPQPLLLGFTTQTAKRDGKAIVRLASGITHIGPGNTKAREYSHLADVLHSALPDLAWHDNISLASWNKLAINCVINPLTALYNCCNGGLRDHQEEVIRICNEVALVMVREGHPTSQQNLLDYVEQVIDSTAENISSMLLDIRLERHTEIDYITGYLLRRARAHGIPVPVNARIYEQVKRKENEYERTSAGLSGTWH